MDRVGDLGSGVLDAERAAAHEGDYAAGADDARDDGLDEARDDRRDGGLEVEVSLSLIHI